MIIYTVMPPEAYSDDDDAMRQPFIQTTVMGVPVLVEPIGDGRGRVERILSTDPESFLSPRLQPGTVVRLP